MQTIFKLTFRRDEDDWDVHIAIAQALIDLKAAQLGKVDVEQHQVGRLALDHGERTTSVVYRVYLVALVGKEEVHQTAITQVVFNYQDTQSHPSCLWPSSLVRPRRSASRSPFPAPAWIHPQVQYAHRLCSSASR